MTLLEDLKWRGLIKDISDEQKLNNFFNNKLSAYVGADPSFKSMHLGNYLTLTLIKRLSKNGHKVYGIVGGITGLIGDPKPSAERQMQEVATINYNAQCLAKQFKEIGGAYEVINNMDFYDNMKIWQFYRNIGKLINVNYLLEKEIIARRLETGISYAEFSYTLLQGYDFLHLYETHNVSCQFGGSDQWGNITTGLEMIRKTHGVDAQACCFSVALLLKADGTKFGKSESGAIYLDPTITSPYTMYQFLINQNDNDVESLLKRLTFLSKEEIEDIMNKQRAEPFKRIAQKELAKNIVIDIHGKEQYEKVLQISEALFSGDLTKLDNQTLYDALSGTNVFNISNDSINIADLLVESNICKSKSEARKLIEQNAISVNGKLINLIDTNITKADAIENKFSYIKKGKRDYTLINFN